MAGTLMKVSSMQKVTARSSCRKVVPCKAMDMQRPGGRGRVAALAEPLTAELPTIQMLDRPGGRGRVAEFQTVVQQVGTISLDRPGGRGRLFVPQPISNEEPPLVVDRPGGRSNRLAFDDSHGNGNGKDGGSGGSGDSGDWSRWPMYAGAYATICAGAWAIHNFAATSAASPAAS